MQVPQEDCMIITPPPFFLSFLFQISNTVDSVTKESRVRVANHHMLGFGKFLALALTSKKSATS